MANFLSGPAVSPLRVAPALHLLEQVVTPFRATEGLKPRAHLGGGHFPPFPSPCDLLSVKLPGGAVLGAKTWARKDIYFHRCKSFSFLPLPSPCPFSLSLASFSLDLILYFSFFREALL